MDSEEFRARREQVLRAIDPGALVVFSAPIAMRNSDVEHEYRQDSDFFYLSGLDEPESVLVLSSIGEPHYTLFVRPRDPEREVWDGPRPGLEGACADYGADLAYAREELDAKLPDLLKDVPRLFYALGRAPQHDAQVLAAIASLRRRTREALTWPAAIHEPDGVLHELRLRKTPRELELLRKAVAITADAHLSVMQAARPGMREYELEAELRRIFREAGSERPAYAPIVGSGPNATVLHHRKNDRRIEDGDLVLVDAGCEYEYYASDVTRTFPANGRFNGPQRAIYDIVLSAQTAAIARVSPGATLDDVHQAALEVIVDGLIDLRLVQGPRDAALEEKRYRPYFMHRTSHWLGMDVHDVGRYYAAGSARTLEPGMVVTVEPGIYVSATADAPGEYRGIGVRIEDDVLVDDSGPVVLSGAIPRCVQEVEQACAR